MTFTFFHICSSPSSDSRKLLWSQELGEDPSVNSMQIAAFQNEHTELGVAQRAELAQLAAAVESGLAALLNIDNGFQVSAPVQW